MKKHSTRQEHFSRTIAVGSEAFVKKVREKLGVRAMGRTLSEISGGGYQLGESISSYQSGESERPGAVRPERNMNMIPWNGDKSLE